MNKPKPVTRITNVDSAAEQLNLSQEELKGRLQKASINLAARKNKVLTTSEIEKLRNMK